MTCGVSNSDCTAYKISLKGTADQYNMPPFLPHIEEGIRDNLGAVTWKDLIIVIDVNGNTFCHKDGMWNLRQTSGDVPKNRYFPAIAVHRDTLYMLFGRVYTSMDQWDHYKEVHALDLCSWRWTTLTPAGPKPQACSFMSTWVHDGKVYCFGGMVGRESMFTLTNQLFCYNTSTNSWELPTTRGNIPSPRWNHSTFVTGDTAFVFGGSTDVKDSFTNDLFTLDMVNMIWTEVHPPFDTPAHGGPGKRATHNMTAISSEVAVLTAGIVQGDLPDVPFIYGPVSWLLDTGKLLRGNFDGPASIWKRCGVRVSGQCNSIVIEPVSKKLWMLSEHWREVETLPFQAGTSLRDLALERAALSFLDTERPILEALELPQDLKHELEAYFPRKQDTNAP